MGIKFFFVWLRKRYTESLINLKDTDNFTKKNVIIDNLMLDINGIIHTCAQKVFKYGEYKDLERILGKPKPKLTLEDLLKKQKQVYCDVADNIDQVFKMVNPTKKLIICIDGPAPLAKQNQQRQRRFLASSENRCNFDSCSISPGTKFMDHLSKYLDWYIHKKLTEDPFWDKIQVIFSNDKAPGEGEHKLLTYIRKYGKSDDSYCIYANDADLIMLSLGTHIKKFYLLRDSLYDKNFKYYIIDIYTIRQGLIKEMSFTEKINENRIINDFIFLCFLVGNDFLPNIPSLEILQHGIDIMFDIYKNVCKDYSYLTINTDKGVFFKRKSLQVFLGSFSEYEKGILSDKYNKKDSFFPDPLLERHMHVTENKYTLDIKNYKKDYYHKKFNENTDINNICQKYLEGLEWTLTYYTKGAPAWRWFYPFNYAPFSDDLAKSLDSYKHTKFNPEEPILPFLQLLVILPPKSSHLLPTVFRDLYNKKLKQYCPDKIDIDLSGKRRKWEGIVILPELNFNTFKDSYFSVIDNVDSKDIVRNKFNQSFLYIKNGECYYKKHYLGDIKNCNIHKDYIDL